MIRIIKTAVGNVIALMTPLISSPESGTVSFLERYQNKKSYFERLSMHPVKKYTHEEIARLLEPPKYTNITGYARVTPCITCVKYGQTLRCVSLKIYRPAFVSANVSDTLNASNMSTGRRKSRQGVDAEISQLVTTPSSAEMVRYPPS